MTDEVFIEAAEAMVRKETEAAIQAARSAPPEAAATGRCLNCDEPLAPPRRWCDEHCRDDWDRERKAAARARGTAQ